MKPSVAPKAKFGAASRNYEKYRLQCLQEHKDSVILEEEEEEPKEVVFAAMSVDGELCQRTEEVSSWRNLDMILLIQNNEVDIQKKVELVFDFVNLRVEEGTVETNSNCETVKISRLIVFLSDWIQSLLISSKEHVIYDVGKPHDLVIRPCLDYRCWKSLKFCMEKSFELNVSLNLSPNLLRAVTFIARNASYGVSSSKEFITESEVSKLNAIILDCMSLLFSSRAGLSTKNLDLWLSTVGAVLKFVDKIYMCNLNDKGVDDFSLKFSCQVLEPFTKFLCLNPTRKNGFHDFVDKLLGPLLHVYGLFHLRTDEHNISLRRNFLKLLEEVLSHGLLHSEHIDGFMCLNATKKYALALDEQPRDPHTSIKSYHRHFFGKLETIIAERKEYAMGALGELFRLLVDRFIKIKGTSELRQVTNVDAKICNSTNLKDKNSDTRRVLTEKNQYMSLNPEAQRSVFGCFVQIMEPLMEITCFTEAQVDVGPLLLNAHCVLKSIRNLLVTLIDKKVYLRTEDDSEGSCLTFLRTLYAKIKLFSSNLLMMSPRDIEKNAHLEVFISVAKEVLVVIGYFLEIEYEAMGNDLVSLWFMIFSYSAISLSFAHVPEKISLSMKAAELGCHLIDLYSQLRQASSIIFALCKAIRFLSLGRVEGETHDARYATSLCNEAYGKSVGMLLSSPEFKRTIRRAVKSMPEGQASGCILQLKLDISETLEWITTSSSRGDWKDSEQVRQHVDLTMELLGKGLSEMYLLVINSLTVTFGNSYYLGKSIEELLLLIRPSVSSLVGQQPDTSRALLDILTGKIFDNKVAADLLPLESSQWIYVFFFQLYMSCRSLYREAISLMPPDASKKMSTAMGDPLTAYSASEWMQRSDWDFESYFSWIIQPSASPLSIVKSVSSIYLHDSSVDCSPLIYVLHTMALQRLTGLNRQIKSLKYLKQNYDYEMQTEVDEDDKLSILRKRIKKCGRLILALQKEAEGLTCFMMVHLSLITKPESLVSHMADASSQPTRERDIWAIGVCNLNKTSFPTALWWIICQSIDIWSIHATKKNFQTFLSFLIHTSHPFLISSRLEIGMRKLDSSEMKNVTLQQISSSLLGDPTFYEQRFVCRYLALRICHVLKKIVLPLFHDLSFGDINLSLSPKWPEVLSSLDNSIAAFPSGQDVAFDKFALSNLSSFSIDGLPGKDDKLNKSSSQSNVMLTACKHLLYLLSSMPKGCASTKSTSLSIIHILNLDRLLFSALFNRQSSLYSSSLPEVFELLVSCRRTLKYLIVTYCEDKTEEMQFSSISVLSEDNLPLVWLCESVSRVVGLQVSFLTDGASQVKEWIFSLMDHTSYIVLTVSKYKFNHCLHALVHEQSNLIEGSSCLDSSPFLESWKSVFLLAKNLKEDIERLVLYLKSRYERGLDIVDIKKFCSLASCFNGFLWAIASALNESDCHREKIVNLPGDFDLCLNVFVELISLFLNMLLQKNSQQTSGLRHYQTLQKIAPRTNVLDAEMYLVKCSDLEVDISGSEDQKRSESAILLPVLSQKEDGCRNTNRKRKRSLLGNTNSVPTILNVIHLVEPQRLTKSFLLGLLKCEYYDAAISFRQIFLAVSAILKLNLLMKTTPLPPSVVPFLTGMSQDLLLVLVDMIEEPQSFSFIWMDGVLKYLEELGHHFPLTDPLKSRNVYAKLIELHLKAIGKCISIQGKKAVLTSHGMESVTKTLYNGVGSPEPSTSLGLICLEEFKAKLRTSFKVLIKKASELLFLSAIQAIERALVGVKEGCAVIYELSTGSKDGGEIASLIAGGVDCLDLVLEFASGRKRAGMVKRHVQSFIASLCSIILHLQSPQMFYVNKKLGSNPDPGAVILMCVELLIRISAKHALFEMDAGHIAQCLQIPSALFQEFLKLKPAEASVPFESSLTSDLVGNTNFVVDRRFSVDLFAACCRLLYTVLRHHKREWEGSISLLEASTRVLLHCLERVESDAVKLKDYFTWEVEEAVKCGSFVRRIYEEIRQQKDTVDRLCSQILSHYIWVYSGHGPLRAGIKSEIDEALRPGVYALMDACTPDDLQYLHTVFGEGPCRNTLANLQRDYQQSFRYGGKV